MTPLDERFGSSPHAIGWYWLRAFAQDAAPPGRAALAVLIVFVLLATSGWTASQRHARPPDPRKAALAAWLHGSVGSRKLPRTDSAPTAIARFFSAIGSRQSVRLADRHPLVVGNLDGAPVRLRYRANRTAISRALADARERARDPRLTVQGRHEAGRRAHRYASLLQGGRQVLAFDPAGRGRAAEVFGDLSTARRVSVVVPGSDTDLDTFESTRRRYSAPSGMAGSLYREARRLEPGAKVAVIAWADYTTPLGVGVDAATGALAAGGAVRLERLLGALPGRSPVSLFCHSYGSVVCGVAAPRLDGRVTDIAVSGSPGMRVDNAAQLRTGARVWAARDRDDWIGNVPHLEFAGLGHGGDPVSPAFGARVVGSERARGHSGYFAPGTGSLENFARIALGRYGTVECTAGNDRTAGGAGARVRS